MHGCIWFGYVGYKCFYMRRSLAHRTVHNTDPSLNSPLKKRLLESACTTWRPWHAERCFGKAREWAKLQIPTCKSREWERCFLQNKAKLMILTDSYLYAPLLSQKSFDKYYVVVCFVDGLKLQHFETYFVASMCDSDCATVCSNCGHV